MDKLWARVKKTKSCWLWTGEKSGNGYGRFQLNGQKWPAHRYFFLLSGRKIPKGMELDHLCRVRNCVNPDHLEAVTRSENIKRAWRVRVENTPNCPKGHPYNEKNLYLYIQSKTGYTVRLCKRCRIVNNHRWRKKAGLKYIEDYLN